MSNPSRTPSRRRWLGVASLAGLACLGAAALPQPAQAWWRGGVSVGIGLGPFYAAPRYYAPPPVYYAPPPAYYPPPVSYAPRGLPSYGAHCSAGAYQCWLPASVPVGSTCSCPGIGAPSYGTVN